MVSTIISVVLLVGLAVALVIISNISRELKLLKSDVIITENLVGHISNDVGILNSEKDFDMIKMDNLLSAKISVLKDAIEKKNEEVSTKDLVDFGNYLLSKERNESFDGDLDIDRDKVWDADIENFMNTKK